MMGSRRRFQPGQQVYIIHANEIKEAVFLNFTKTNEFDVRVLPHYEEVTLSTIYENRDQAEEAFRIIQDKNSEKANRTLQLANGHSVCEQCGSVTTTGKACECSRWA